MGGDAAARGAHDSKRHQPAALRDAQGHHGGQEEGNPQGQRSRVRLAAAEDREPVPAGKGQENADHRRLGGGGGEGAGAQAARGRASDVMILVIAEQRNGRLNRATWETIAAAQQLGAAGQLPLVILVPGGDGSAAAEVAAAQAKEVVTVAHAGLEPYTPDGFTAVLQEAIRQLSPQYVLRPHTYQTLDFA